MPFWNSRSKANDTKSKKNAMTRTNENSSKQQHIDAYSAHTTYNSTAATAMLLNHHHDDDDDDDEEVKYQYTTMDSKGVKNMDYQKNKKKNTPILNRQESDVSDQQTASSSVFMSASMMGRVAMNQAMEVYPSHKFDVGKPVVVSPDEVAVMQKNFVIMTVEAGGFGRGKSGSRASHWKLGEKSNNNTDAWIDAVNQQQQENVGFHGKPPEGIIAHHPNYRQKRRSSAPSKSAAIEVSANADAKGMTKGIISTPTNASDGNMDQKKQVSALQKKLSVQTKTSTAKTTPSPRHRHSNIISPLTSPKYATQRQLELMKVGAANEAANITQVPPKVKSLRPSSITRRRSENQEKPTSERPPANRNTHYNTSSINMFNRSSMASRSSMGLMSETSSLSSIGSLPDLHEDLNTASWSSMHKNLTYLATNAELILPALTVTNTEYCTPLHIAVWKVSICLMSSYLTNLYIYFILINI